MEARHAVVQLSPIKVSCPNCRVRSLCLPAGLSAEEISHSSMAWCGEAGPGTAVTMYFVKANPCVRSMWCYRVRPKLTSPL